MFVLKTRPCVKGVTPRFVYLIGFVCVLEAIRDVRVISTIELIQTPVDGLILIWFTNSLTIHTTFGMGDCQGDFTVPLLRTDVVL